MRGDNTESGTRDPKGYDKYERKFVMKFTNKYLFAILMAVTISACSGGGGLCDGDPLIVRENWL